MNVGEDGAISFEAALKTINFERSIKHMEDDIRGLSNSTAREASKMNASFDKLGLSIAAVFSAGVLSNYARDIIRITGEFQKFEAVLRNSLGSEDAAKSALAMISEYAAKSPSQLAEVTEAYIKLVNQGFKPTYEDLTKLGDLAASTGKSFDQLTEAIIDAQVGEFERLKEFGVRASKEGDKVTFAFKGVETQVAFTQEAIRGYILSLGELQGVSGATAAISATLVGQISNLEDAWDRMLNDIGQSNAGIISTGIEGVASLVENYQKVLDVLEILIVTYGTYRAALILTTVAQKAYVAFQQASIVAETASQLGMKDSIAMLTLKAGAINVANAAQAAFNRTILANPYFLASAALVALVAVIYKFATATNEAEEAAKRLQDAEARHKGELEATKGKINELVATIKNQNLTYEQQESALNQLKSISHGRLEQLTVEAVKTGQATAAINDYIDALNREALAKARQEIKTDNYRKIEELKLKKQRGDYSIPEKAKAFFQSFGKGLYSAMLDVNVNEQIKALEAQNKALNDAETKQAEALAKRSTIVQEQVIQNAEFWEGKRKELDAMLKGLSDEAAKGKEGLAIKKQIAEVEKKLDAYDLPKSGTVRSSSKEAKKETQTFRELLDERKSMYAQYEQAVANGYVLEAKSFYNNLLSQGETYADFLKNVIEPLEEKSKNGSLTNEQFSQMALAKAELDDVMGKSPAIDAFAAKLEDLKNSSFSLTEYISTLKEELKSLEGGNSSFRIAARKKVSEELKSSESEVANMYNQFLMETNAFQTRRRVIEEKYNTLRYQAEKQHNGKLLQEQKKLIEKQEVKELQALNDEMVTKTDSYKELYKEVLYLTNQEIKDKIEAAKEILKADDEKSEKLKMSDEERRRRLIDLHNLEMQLAKKQADTWVGVAQSIGEVGDALSGYGGALGEVGAALSSIANAARYAGSAYQAYKENQALINDGDPNTNPDVGNKVGWAMSGVSQLIAMYVNSRQKKKAQQKAKELEIISFQVEMNRLLSEEIRLRTILSENVYFKDYAGRIGDAMDSAADAVVRYQKAIGKLIDEGQAFQGFNDAIDWGNVLSGATIGASSGTAIGGWIGAIVGLVVGGVVGLLSKKNKAVYDSLIASYPELIDANGELNTALAETLISTNAVDDKTKLALQDAINLQGVLDEAKQQITDIVSELTGSMGGELRDALVEAFEDGEDAAYRFADTVENTLENALKNLIYSSVFSKAFSKLQEQLEMSLMGNGESFQSVFADFLGQSEELTKKFNEMMQAAVDEGKKFGFDLFNGESENDRRMQGSIQSLSEQTGSALLGQFNAMRVNQAAGNQILTNQLFALNKIAANTEYNRRLVDIDRSLRQMNNPQWWRDMGVA